GDIRLLEEFQNDDPSSPLPPKELKFVEPKTEKSSIDKPPKLELKDLPSHLEYLFLEDADKLPIIIAKNLKDDEKARLLKGGTTRVTNDDNELIPTTLVTGWRICIDYRKLDDATRKDHFPLPFMDQMLERLTENEFFCFLDVTRKIKRKTPSHCPYGTFAYRRMPFGLCDAPGTFQRCMMAIFHNMIEETIEYILVAVDYLCKWVEAKALPTNDACVVVKILKSLFARFGTPRAIISDRGTHFCNDQFVKVMLKYRVTHRISTTYHPQISGQVEVSNHGLKRILERTIGENRTSWSDKLDDALWAFRTAFKTPIGCTPYKLVYEMAFHLPIELEHKAY
nr:reverse transcriptase domain-containing protein [Tanacetum cinerariifolium]